MSSASRLRCIRPLVLAVAGVVLLLSPAPASAQLSRVGGSIAAFYPGGIMRGTDTAYDPVNDRYLLVMGHGPIYGIFVNSSGQPVTPAFTIFSGSTAFATFPRTEYSPHVSNGAGGLGGFLVAWHQGNSVPNYVYGRIVAFEVPGQLVSAPQVISDNLEYGSRWESWPAIAYSPTSRRFLVAWNTYQWGIRGRFVDTNGSPTGSVMQLENAGGGPSGSRDPSIAWNSATDEFGLVYTAFADGKGAWAAFRRIRAADGAVSGRTSFGFSAGTFATAIDVNAATNRYVMVWALHPGTMSAVFDQNGTQISTNFVTGRMGYDQSLGMAFNAITGTFLTVGSDGRSLEVGATELNGNGEPMPGYQIVTDGATTPAGSVHPLAAARTGTNQWDIVYSRDFRGATNQIVASGSNGASAPTPVPASAPAPAPTAPAPSSSGCTTPDPFVSIGGGTCVSGGWRPGGTAPAPAATPTPVAAPAPAPSSSGCTTPDPFVSIGGGTCVGGGWRPGGGGSVNAAPAPAALPTPVASPSPSTCTTPDPFVSIGGGTCVGGGWVPRSGGCVGPDPFTSIGGGVCISGGWVPSGR